ncbi:hypothetical protein F383_31935 [Gossypium arboreum]|uniref:Uncharacterized protein n=1 Tax=Gossypium arboreum TaxID=29729 RepID=A0A0B0MVJ8_GOSAR|nr:hypothetical protein F383_31935 [Gossypium arboreum]
MLNMSLDFNISMHRVDHASNSVRISYEAKRPIKPQHPRLRCQLDLFRVTPRESHGYEDRVEVVEVEVGDGAAEEEASRLEVLVGDRVFACRKREGWGSEVGDDAT